MVINSLVILLPPLVLFSSLPTRRRLSCSTFLWICGMSFKSDFHRFSVCNSFTPVEWHHNLCCKRRNEGKLLSKIDENVIFHKSLEPIIAIHRPDQPLNYEITNIEAFTWASGIFAKALLDLPFLVPLELIAKWSLTLILGQCKRIIEEFIRWLG